MSSTSTKRESKQKKIADKLERELKADPIWTDHWVPRFKEKAKLTSHDQLGRVLFDSKDKGGLGLDNENRTKKGKYATDAKTFENMDLPFVEKHVRFSKFLKSHNTWLKNILEATLDGVFRNNFNLHTTKTMRGSANDPNSQNWPIRDEEIGKLIRNCFIASKGHVILEADFKGIEVCVSGCYHKDKNFIRYITDKKSDMHRDMAAQCFKIPPEQVSKMARYCAKNMFVFPQFYGDWYKSCARSLWLAVNRFNLELNNGKSLRKHLNKKGLTERGACEARRDPESGTFEHHLHKVERHFWDVRFQEYADWKRRAWERYEKRGHVLSLTGFVYGAGLNRKQVANYPIQGSAFHCLLLALILLNKWLRKKKMKSKIINTIHDSLILDAHRKELDELIPKIVEIMTKEVPRLYPWIIVPLEVEIEVSPPGGSWYDKEAVPL